MERKKFIKNCCYAAIGIPLGASFLESCGVYYATTTSFKEKIVVPKSEFIKIKKEKKIFRQFIYVEVASTKYPICLYKEGEEDYIATLLKCTHRGCELNVGGGVYSCLCHGSEFTIRGKVLEGPATKRLQTFKTSFDNENIYIHLS